MQGSSKPLLVGVGVVVVLVCVGPQPTTATNDDYVTTELDDPLQPVWDRLDELPRLVSEEVDRNLDIRFSSLETKLNRLDGKVSTVTTALRRLEGSDPHHLGYPYLGMGLSQNHLLAVITELAGKIEHHIDSQVSALETRLKEYIDEKLSHPAAPAAGGNGSSPVVEGDASLSVTLRENTATLENINTHVLKINEKIGGGSESENSCSTLVDKVSELMEASAGGSAEACSGLDQQALRTISQISQTSSFLPRDCSDKHWQQPESPSGVYETFPTLDPKAPVNSYCDMGEGGVKDKGGWTVILRRRNSTWGLVDFNRTWSEYRKGFGNPGEGEWWFGLGPLHALTYRQPFEVDLFLHDIELGTYYANYNSFRVEDEAQNFTLNMNGFRGNLTHDALVSKHHGSPFSTWDRDNDKWGAGSCAKSNGGGWWFNACHYTTLTAPFPTSNDREARTIRWLEDEWLVIDDVTMKIRPVNYAQRFNTNHLG